MTDPLSQIIELLRPRAVFSKGISGAGRWAVRYSTFGEPGFCAVLEGGCRLAVDGEAPVDLQEGDFVLLPATPAFTLSSFEPARPRHIDPKVTPAPSEEVRHGRQDGPAELRLLGGYFVFSAADAALLVSLLPAMIHVRGARRLSLLVGLVGEEAAGGHAGREFALSRLVELLLVEALRAAPGGKGPPGLLRGLADPRLANALRRIHADPQHGWTIAGLAVEAGMSRSAFFDRFARTVGLPPMEYLQTWRMALAKDLLRGGDVALDEVARRVGYGSASTFSTAFSRTVGQPPGRFARTAVGSRLSA
jgi:AraC-like DNA-binding protein